MTYQSATIDLGVIGPASREDDAPHLAASRRHWSTGRVRLWWPAALLSATLVLLAGAAATPAPSWATDHLAVPAGSRFALDATTLYAIDPPAAGAARSLSAYRLADGALRWRIEWPAAAPPMVWPDLLLMVHPRSGAREGSVTALDPRTGRARWTRTGSVVGRAGDNLVLRVDDRLHSYDVRAGTRVASLPAAGRLPRQVVGDLLLLWGAGAVVHAYDLATLTRRWSTGVTGQWRGGVVACGRLLCLSRGDKVLALDPATGRPVWWTGWLALPEGGRVDLVAGGPAWGERLVLQASQPTGGRSWLVDANDGAPVVELRHWRPVRLPSHAAATAGQPEALLTRYLNRVTWFAQVRAEPPGIAVLGAIKGGPQHDCRRAEAYLACYSRQMVRVWRLRLP